jgi:hypothetical protein
MNLGSSIRSSRSSDWTRVPLPEIAMSFRLPLELLYLLYDVLVDEHRVLPLQRAL